MNDVESETDSYSKRYDPARKSGICKHWGKSYVGCDSRGGQHTLRRRAPAVVHADDQKKRREENGSDSYFEQQFGGSYQSKQLPM